MAAATTIAVTLPLTAGSALAAPPRSTSGQADPAYPSKAQVDKARADVAAKAQSVQQIEGQLAAASARMEEASMAAEAAAEKYNGARWALEEARKATLHAQAVQRAAAADVRRQRDGIVLLVTESYQNGTQLGTATALMSDDGPQGLMNRYGVVQSAGDSMNAAYDRYRAASARAKDATAKAAKAEDKQTELAAEAKKLADAAGAAAQAAGAAANEIAQQRTLLVSALAKAQNISVELAGKRQRALEEIARKRAAEARRAAALAKAAAEAKAAKAAKAAAEKAAKKAAQEKKDQPAAGSGSSAPVAPPTSSPAPVIDPAPNQSVAVQRTIAYAKAQLGKPYLWAAAGPDRFDCSGLTMQAWARGGKSLPHYSVAQYAQSTPIRMADARPGDLLFWSNNGSPSGIHHVALYLGGGQFIEAPHTGSWVRYNSIYNWYPDFVARP